MQNLLRLEGQIGWTEIGENQRVNQAIARPDELALDITYEGHRFSGTLKLQVDQYNGFLTRSNGGRSTGSVEIWCRRFDYDESVLLFGRWKEDGKTYKVWMDLDQTDG